MDQFETLFNQAISFAEQKQWEKAIETLKQVIRINPDDVVALNSLGTCLLNAERATEAIPYFEKAALIDPYQAEVKNNLGVAFIISGNLTEAEMALKESLRVNDKDSQTWKNLAQVYLLQGDRLVDGLQILSSVVQNNPNDIDALFQLALCYEIGGDIESARLLLKRILTLQPDHSQAQSILDDINEKAQSDLQRAAAHPEYVKKLASLKSLVHSDNVSGGQAVTLTPASSLLKAKSPAQPKTTKIAAFYAPGDFASVQRTASISAFYARCGFNVKPMSNFTPEHLSQFESLIFYNPNLSAQLIDAINQCIQKEKNYCVDLDTDFHNLPMDHPAYTQLGQGNSKALQVLEIVLGNSQLLTTASTVLAQRYKSFAKQVEVAQPAWTNSDPWWDRHAPSRNTINIGWLGTKADLPDLLKIKTPVSKLLNQFPQTIWIAAGCDEAYDIFSKLPEERRLFLPPPTGDALAFLLTNFDIFLVPLRDNLYNQAKSDLQLLYAGIRRIPWLASPIQAFMDWNEGGVVCHSLDDWHKELLQLVENAELRRQFGDAGRKKAEEREVTL